MSLVAIFSSPDKREAEEGDPPGGVGGGVCIMKNDLALCGRRRARAKGVVSGPKACTPK